MSLDPIYGNLTNIVHEDMLPNQKKNAHFLPVGEPVPDGCKVLENSVSCVFFVYIHETSCELSTTLNFLSRLAFGRIHFYSHLTQVRMIYAPFLQIDQFGCVSDLTGCRWLRLKMAVSSRIWCAHVTSEGYCQLCCTRKVMRVKQQDNPFYRSNPGGWVNSQHTCAPEASPTTRTRACGSPNPGTGLPQ